MSKDQANSENVSPHHDLGANRSIDPDVEVELPQDDPHRLRDEIDIMLTIFLGGFFGTLARYIVGIHWVQRPSGFPVSYLVINVSGSLVIGLLVTLIVDHLPPTRYLRPLTCVGFLGGWTTMSTVAVGADHLVSSGHVVTALAYLIAIAITTPLFAMVGICSAHRLPRHTRALTK